MKTVLLAVLVTLMLFGVSAQTNCASTKLTFNLKPKYPNGDSLDYVCEASDVDKIESLLSSKIGSVLKPLGYTNIALSNVRTDRCPNFGCESNPGDKCLPYCVDMTYCVSDALYASTGTTVISDAHLGQLAQDQIDALRASLPACLGVKNQFMLDAHYSSVQ